MAFWGVSIEAGGSLTLPASNPPRRLKLTRGSVMEGTSLKPWCAVYCSVGGLAPVIIFRADHLNTVSLNFEYEETRDIVFTLRGPRGVHLSGYYVVDRSQNVDSSPLIIPEALNPVEMLEKLPTILKNVAMIEKYTNIMAKELVKEIGQNVEGGLNMEHTTSLEKDENLVCEAQTNNTSGSDDIGVNENGNERKCTSDDGAGALALISLEHGEVPKEVGHGSLALDILSHVGEVTVPYTSSHLPSTSSQPTVDFSRSHQVDSNREFLNFLLPSNLIISAIVSKLKEDFESNNIYGGMASLLRSQQGDFSPCSDNEIRLADSTNLKFESSLEKSEMDGQLIENILNRESSSSMDKSNVLSDERDLKEKQQRKKKRENSEAKMISGKYSTDRKFDPSNAPELESRARKLKKKESDKKSSTRSDDCNIVKAEMSKQKDRKEGAEDTTVDRSTMLCPSIEMSSDDLNLKVMKHRKRKRENEDSNVVPKYPVESPEVDSSAPTIISEVKKTYDVEGESKSEQILKKRKKHEKVEAVAADEKAAVLVEKKKSGQKERMQETSNDVGKAEKCQSCGHNLEKTVHDVHAEPHNTGEGEHKGSTKATKVQSSTKKAKEAGAVKIKKASGQRGSSSSK